MVGPAATEMAQEINNSPDPRPSYIFHPPQLFGDGPFEVRRAIYDYHHWLVIIVNANATALLLEAATNGNGNYDPISAMQIVYVQARHEATIANCRWSSERYET